MAHIKRKAADETAVTLYSSVIFKLNSVYISRAIEKHCCFIRPAENPHSQFIRWVYNGLGLEQIGEIDVRPESLHHSLSVAAVALVHVCQRAWT